MKYFSNSIKSVFLALMLFFSYNAFALTLQEAKSQGLVGEQPNGYLGAVVNPSTEVSNLINQVNGQRKAEYQKISAQRNVPLQQVEALAGQQTIEMTVPGMYIQVNGTWIQK